ncbi:MAG: 5-(carboxyamino)imidazole ribonucleotide synthase [Nitrospira sp.]|nr:MAG: 5-(carboxyamino)imidazole ribonucleotide synthase [Nitrospira sp.]
MSEGAPVRRQLLVPTVPSYVASRLTPHALEPGAMLGVLGGGQLGAMFAAATRRLGYRVAVWDPDPEAPALRQADRAIARPFSDAAVLTDFTRSVSAATYEWENIPAATASAIEAIVPLRPSARTLATIQNRLDQKTFLSQHGIPVAPFAAIRILSELQVSETVGYPCLCKTATAGYDGKGQWRLETPRDLDGVREELTQAGAMGPWVLERFLAFEKELSVLVVRGADQDHRIYPVVENRHEAGILRVTRVPAVVDRRVAERAQQVAVAVVDALGGVGVFCVELFLMPDGGLFVNEVASRPHNSGHYTLDACTVSQFEQQVRVVGGLPLGEARLLCPAVMINLIGDDVLRATSGDRLPNLLRMSGAKLHLYGKREVRVGRKMGHVTFLGEKPDDAWTAAGAFHAGLG